MSRIAIATIAGLIGMTAYVVAVLLLGDHVQEWHWALQALFFALAGLVWVIPVRRLMYWAAGK